MRVARIRPFLWFAAGAAEAARFYVSIFEGASIEESSEYSVRFKLYDQEFIAFQGGPQPGFAFSPAISFMVECDTQAEIDHLWSSLGEGGEPSRCGWLRDKFGVTWQIVPAVLGDLLGDDDRDAADRALQAMLTMTKLDIGKLEAAHAG